MTEQTFKAKAIELMQQMVDAIADKDYAKLIHSIPPKTSWASFQDADPTLENACLGFGKWLEEQLAMWDEDEDKAFAVDHFDASCIEDIEDLELEDDDTAFVTYNPTSAGEPLDCWFEIEFKVEGEQVTAVFDVNV